VVRLAGSERQSTLPSERRLFVRGRCRGTHASGQGKIRATLIGAQPNMRLKLTAPSCCGGHLFVKSSRSRRSLNAVR